MRSPEAVTPKSPWLPPKWQESCWMEAPELTTLCRQCLLGWPGWGCYPGQWGWSLATPWAVGVSPKPWIFPLLPLPRAFLPIWPTPASTSLPHDVIRPLCQ